jgi:oxygen-independent coproporphyrinogen III oxidase
MNKFGLYLHIPFCEYKCGYCDFYSATNFDEYSERFSEAILKEITIKKDLRKNVDSIFFGGGTPSMLSIDQFDQIMTRIRQSYTISPDCEITVESNPNSVDKTFFQDLKKLGINRISFGVQSFIDKELKIVERIHSADEAINSYFACRDAKFTNISIDLIFALPKQKREDWKYNLRKLIELKPEHLSAYNLIIEKNTKFGQLAEKGLLKKQSDDFERDLYEYTINFLKQENYIQYEISNFSLNNQYKSRHNFKYWNFEPYIGFGPSAHSYDGKDMRSWNIRSTEKYIEMIGTDSTALIKTEQLDEKNRIFESIMLGFRLNQGIDYQKFNKTFNLNFLEYFKKSIDKYTNIGFLELNETFCFLTEEGRFYCDAIACDFETH